MRFPTYTRVQGYVTMNHRIAAVVSAVILAAAACAAPAAPSASGGTPASRPPTTPATAAAPAAELAKADLARTTPSPALASSAASAVNALGLSLYGPIASGSGANLVYSPASIGLALAMARPGAKGATASQMDTVLHGLASDQAALDAINALAAQLDARNATYQTPFGPLPVALRIANAPFGQRGEQFERAYLDALATSFGAGLRLVDYKANPEAARQAINAWVGDQTDGRIPDLLAPGVLNDQTRLALVNAVYLKAAWQNRFWEASQTPTQAFTRTDGSTVEVPMMQGGGTLPYAAGTGWRAVELPYVGDQLAMLVIVPDDLATFAASFDAARLDAIVKVLGDREVILGLPRFKAQSKVDLATVLAGLGMPLAFDDRRADLSAITTQERLYITAVVHQANIDVDENGTEAAAATAVAIASPAASTPEGNPPITLTVDHPFLFAIRDRSTGALLFLGRVADPSAKQ